MPVYRTAMNAPVGNSSRLRSRQRRLFAALLLPHISMATGAAASGGSVHDTASLDARASGHVTINQRGSSITIGNDYLERTLTIEGGRLRTSKLTNKLSHRTYFLSGDEFQIDLIDDIAPHGQQGVLTFTTNDLMAVDKVVAKERGGGQKITFHLKTHRRDSRNVFLEVSYELEPRDFYTRQWIKVRASPGKILYLHYLTVFKDKWDPVGPSSLGGLGQPLFGEDVFMGLEYPTGINERREEEVNLGSYVGLDIPKEGFVSAPAVLGVTLPGRVHDAFMEYISRIRSVPARPHIEYNNFYDVFHTGMNTHNTLERVAELKAHLLKPYSLHLDTFTLDDGWDDPENLWAVDQKRFPNGFGDVVKALNGLGANLGLWLSPMGGSEPLQGEIIGDHRLRAAAGERIGLEVANTRYFCMAGDAYNRYLRRVVVGLITKYNVNYFKFDGIPVACSEPGRGHAEGIYSREAITRNVIALARVIRAANPHAVIDLATGPLLSPWWLLYADLVDYGGIDYGHIEAIPAPTARQSAISYRDSILYQDVRAIRVQFPISSLSSTGIIKVRDLLGGREESLDDWKDEIVNYVGAGEMYQDLMLSPTGVSNDLLTRAEWGALGQTLKYFVRNGHPLVDSATLVLGDPARGQPYGYVHYSDTKTIVLLRNPSMRPAHVSLRVTEENGFEPTRAHFWADVVYPFRESLPGVFSYGSALEVTLDGYEQQVVELTPVRGDMPRIEGVRFSQLASGDGNINYTLYAANGSEAIVHLANSSVDTEAAVDGRRAEMEAATETGQRMIRIHFGRAGTGVSQPNCQRSRIRSSGEQGSAQRVEIHLLCHIPSDFQQSEVAVLLESAEGIPDVQGEVLVDGTRAPVAFQRSKVWYWGTAAVVPGRHTVEFELRLHSGIASDMRVSGWLRARRLLSTRKLSLILKHGTTVHPAEADLLPISSQLERKTYVLFRQTID